MKNVVSIMLFCSVGFSNVQQKISQGYPTVTSEKISVGKAVFKNGFFAVDKTAEKIQVAEVKVDSFNKKINIKWYLVSTLTDQRANLKQMLSTRKTGLPLNSIVSPILDLASDNKARNPFYTPIFSFSGAAVQATKDPFVQTHEEQYLCRPEKNACFQIGAESTPNSKAWVTASGDGSSLSFRTEYEYSLINPAMAYTCGNGSPHITAPCLKSGPDKLKYHPVVLTEVNLSEIYQNYLIHLADVIDRTLTDHSTVLNSMNAIVAAGKTCFYNLTLQVESRLRSEMIEDIRGNGIDEQCFKRELSTLRSQFSPEELHGFRFSEEQIKLGHTLNEIEKKCPFEVWVGPRNQYKILKKDCVAAGIRRLESKTRQVQNELLRYTK